MEDCTWCGRVSGAVGLVVGLAIAYIGLDLVLDGAVTRLVTRGARPALSVVTGGAAGPGTAEDAG